MAYWQTAINKRWLLRRLSAGAGASNLRFAKRRVVAC